jgi:uncharacterized RDD family membrane protein YckC
MEQILDDFREDEQDLRRYEMASKGQRFANYMIDLIAYSILSFILGMVMANSDPFADNVLLSYLFGALTVMLYYFLLENFTGGKSIGKFVTNTRAVNIDNSRIDANKAIARSLIRIVPFEAFSYLGSSPTGWHDDWSKTKVIVDRDWQG